MSAAGKFTQGSVLRHVLVMTSTGSIGLMAIFAVDFLNLIYIGWLKDEAITAALGFASSLLFATISVGIGLMIAVSALVARALGARQRELAERRATSGLVYSFLVMAGLSLVLLAFAEPLLRAMGARGSTLDLALRFLWITLPTTPLLGLGMTFTNLLRALGDAQRGMWTTLSIGLATVALDPLFIFLLDLKLDGAAYVLIIARVVYVLVGAYGVIHVHQLIIKPRWNDFRQDVRALTNIALPTILTNIATPIAAAYVTAAMSRHSEAAVAAWTIINRITPLAFGASFALAAAIGPIVAQNFGAQRFDRVRDTLRHSFIVVSLYVVAVCVILYLSQDGILHLFHATGAVADLVRFYCTAVAGTFLFLTWIFVANGAFNNLGFPFLSMLFNWGRATLGTVPFVIWFSTYWGAPGVLTAQGLGALPFGIGAFYMSFVVIRRLEMRSQALDSAAAPHAV